MLYKGKQDRNVSRANQTSTMRDVYCRSLASLHITFANYRCNYLPTESELIVSLVTSFIKMTKLLNHMHGPISTSRLCSWLLLL